MKIQKLVARIFFAAASFCWVGCNDNSVSPVVTPDTSSSVEPGSSSEPGSSAASSSSSEVRSSSSDERIPPMSATVYGIEPAFSSSSEETSSSSEEVMSSSSVEVIPGSSQSQGDSLAAAMIAVDVCETHSGVQSVGGYSEPWTSPERQGKDDAEYDMKLKIQDLLQSKEAESFSKEKVRCLEDMERNLGELACMYGVPMPYEYDKWVVTCSDGTVVKSPEYEAKILDDSKRTEAARKEAAQELEDKFKKCDDSSAEI